MVYGLEQFMWPPSGAVGAKDAESEFAVGVVSMAAGTNPVKSRRLVLHSRRLD
jgi:hypothetical protein